MEILRIFLIVMVEHNIKRYVYAIIVVFLVGVVSSLLAFNALGLSKGAWDVITTSISFTAIIVVLFVSWAWRWRGFQGWFVPIPNLNGKWEGSIKFKDNGEDRTRKVSVDIKQTFLSIVVRFRSKESDSLSFCGSFNIDEKRGIKQLIYSYQNDPNANIRETSPVHYGTTKLDIGPDNKSLTGEYWTSRKTMGTIVLKKK